MIVAARGVRRGSRAVLVAAAISVTAAHAQTCPDAPPDPDAAWSAGFATFVGRFCPGWSADAEAMGRARALPGLDPACFATQVAPGSPAARAFHDGAEAAEAARGADPSFCAEPGRSPPARPAVGAFIARKPA